MTPERSTPVSHLLHSNGPGVVSEGVSTGVIVSDTMTGFVCNNGLPYVRAGRTSWGNVERPHQSPHEGDILS